MALSVSVQKNIMQYCILQFPSTPTSLEAVLLTSFTWFLTVSHLRLENVSKAVSDSTRDI